jgi:uncharacterized protein (TIGR00369 family)
MSRLAELVEQCRGGQADYQSLVDHVPYARFLGIQLETHGEELTFVLPRNEENVGNPTLPALHGGAVAGFMEQSAIIFLLLEMGEPRIPKTIDFTIDYLRAGKLRDTFAECRVTRLGSRVANLAIDAWQVRRDQPIAIARSHFLLSEETEEL